MHTHVPREGRSNRLSPYLLWLVWVIWLPFASSDITKLLQAHLPLVRLIATLVAVAFFFCVYLWVTLRNAFRLTGTPSSTERTVLSQWFPVALLVALSLLIILLYRGVGSPFIFTSAYIGGRLPTMRAVQAIVVLVLLIVGLGSLHNPDWSYLEQGIVLVSVVGIVTALITRSIMTSRELRIAREEIARLAVTAERLRIARDLHDLLGHNLSLITLKSELAGRLISVSPERAASEIGDVEQVARTTLQEVREAVGNYRQPTLANELHAAQEILAAAGIIYAYEEDQSIQGTLPPPIEAVLSWTVREGVTNVIRHSRAHRCTVRVTYDTHNAHVEVIDDGAKTATLSSSVVPSIGSTSNGLRGLMERIAALGGQCEAQAQASGGFRLAVSVPLA